MSDIDTSSSSPESPTDEPVTSEPDPTDDAPTEAAPDAAPGDTAPEPEVADAEAETAEPGTVADAEPRRARRAEAESAEPEVAAAEAGDAAEPGADAAAGEAVMTEDELIEQSAVIDNPYTRPGRWFVVHTQSGYEKKVKQNLEARIHSMNAEEAVYEVVIPMEDYVDFKNGKRVVSQRKMFPGYLLVRAELDDTAWFVIRNTPGVTGFVGQGAKPSPLPKRDVEAFLMPKGSEEQVATRAKPRMEYELGETVRVKEGPFADFSGEVIELNEDQLKLKVLVNIFGRETPVELEFSKVAKL